MKTDSVPSLPALKVKFTLASSAFLATTILSLCFMSLLEQAQKEVGAMKKDKKAVIHGLGELRDTRKRAECGRDGFEA